MISNSLQPSSRSESRGRGLETGRAPAHHTFPSSSLRIPEDAQPGLPWGKAEVHLISLIFPPPPEAHRQATSKGWTHRGVGVVPLLQVALSLDQKEKEV